MKLSDCVMCEHVIYTRMHTLFFLWSFLRLVAGEHCFMIWESVTDKQVWAGCPGWSNYLSTIILVFSISIPIKLWWCAVVWYVRSCPLQDQVIYCGHVTRTYWSGARSHAGSTPAWIRNTIQEENKKWLQTRKQQWVKSSNVCLSLRYWIKEQKKT